MHLNEFGNNGFDRGAGRTIELIWNLLSTVFVSSSIPGSFHRRIILRCFGASVGRGVVIKPSVTVKFPWKLSIGDHSWIGENVWIDNLAEVKIAENCCISQGAYFCTGSHDWSKRTFDLITKPIEMKPHSWVGAKTVVGPGVVVAEYAVLALGSCATSNLKSGWVHVGNPANPTKKRNLSR